MSKLFDRNDVTQEPKHRSTNLVYMLFIMDRKAVVILIDIRETERAGEVKTTTKRADKCGK